MAKIIQQPKDKPAENPLRVGEILLNNGLITSEQLEKALRILSKLDEDKTLEDLLVDLGFAFRKQIKTLLQTHRQELKIGEILIEMGLIKESDLDLALQIQSKDPTKKLGEILLKQGLVSDKDFTLALCQQLNLQYVDPDVDLLDHKLMDRVSLPFLKKNLVIPFSRSKDSLIMLTHNPTDPPCVLEFREIYGCDVKIAVALKERIMHTLNSYEEFKNTLCIKEEDIFQLQKSKVVKSSTTDQVSKTVSSLIKEAVNENASDIHIEPLSDRIRIRYRIDGYLVHKTDLPAEYASRIISMIKVLADMDIAEKRRHQDGRLFIKIDNSEIDLRVSSYVTVFGENVVLRILNKTTGLVELPELGLAPKMLETYIEEVLEIPTGVAIMTGPTGCGKTTTLYSSLSHINNTFTKIITAEDPVEYVIEGISQCSINPKIGLNFQDTLKAIVRQDPDIVVLGEIRDKYSAEVAIQAALTGHKVFSTFHTEDSVGGILRLIDMDIETFLISSTVISVLAQRLVRKVCPVCKRVYTPPEKILRKLSIDPAEIKKFRFYKGSGCSECLYTGYRGRTGIFEILVLDESVKEAILAKKTSYEIRRISVNTTGLISMQEDGIVKALNGLTTLEEVLHHAPRSFETRPISKILELTGW